MINLPVSDSFPNSEIKYIATYAIRIIVKNRETQNTTLSNSITCHKAIRYM